MKRTRWKTFPQLSIVWFSFSLGLLSPACRHPGPEPIVEVTDLVLISIDTLRRDHLSAYGYARDTSPHLRRLAAEGVVFETALAAHTNTGPSHASMLTGLYPQSHGVTRNREPIRPELETLAHRLRRRGYRTAAFVSGWTLSDEATGLGSGFEVYDDDVGRRERRAPETWRAARRWLGERYEEEPWFLFFHLFDPHYP
ncbi:MAG: sulfatase-like hydrolase/transferase, partial [Thermoanaerobaculia bacterium]